LCERIENGAVVVKRCLNEAGLFQSFGDICDDDGEGHAWVSVFKESKKSNEAFSPLKADTIIVFCKLQEPNFIDPSYLGYHLVPKQMQCSALVAQVRDMARMPFKTKFKAELERENQMAIDITREQSSLHEFGVHSGSCLTLALLQNKEKNASRVVRLAPRAVQQGDMDGDACDAGKGSLISQFRRLQEVVGEVLEHFLKKLSVVEH